MLQVTIKAEGAPTKVAKVANLAEASKVVRQYIVEFDLITERCSGGTVQKDGKTVAIISYNGRAWPPGEWRPGNKDLPLDTAL